MRYIEIPSPKDGETRIIAIYEASEVDTLVGGPASALKDVQTAVAASEVSAVVAATAVNTTFVQAELQTIVDLVNDLQLKYDAAVLLINEMKGIIDNMNA